MTQNITMFKNAAIGDYVKLRPHGFDNENIYVKVSTRTVKYIHSNPDSAAATSWIGLTDRIEIVDPYQIKG